MSARQIINTQDEQLHLAWESPSGEISLIAAGGDQHGGYGGFEHSYKLDRRKARALRDALDAALAKVP